MSNNKESNVSYGGVGVSEFPRSIAPDYEILEPWFNLIRSMRSQCTSNGMSGITVRVIVDEHGMPKLWAEPKAIHISPVRETEFIEGIVGTLTSP